MQVHNMREKIAIKLWVIDNEYLILSHEQASNLISWLPHIALETKQKYRARADQIQALYPAVPQGDESGLLTDNEIQECILSCADEELVSYKEVANCVAKAQLAKARQEIPQAKQESYNTGFADGENYSFTANQTLEAIKEQAVKAERERIIKWGDERVKCEHVLFYHRRKTCEGCWQDFKGESPNEKGE